jgi:hypothetical protein
VKPFSNASKHHRQRQESSGFPALYRVGCASTQRESSVTQRGIPPRHSETTMSKTTKPMDTAQALAAINTLLRSVEAGWIPAARKISAARRALDALQVSLKQTDSRREPSDISD